MRRQYVSKKANKKPYYLLHANNILSVIASTVAPREFNKTIFFAPIKKHNGSHVPATTDKDLNIAFPVLILSTTIISAISPVFQREYFYPAQHLIVPNAMYYLEIHFCVMPTTNTIPATI